MFENDIIEASECPCSAPIFLVGKKDSTYRFAIDYRGLNAVTVKDAYPLPNIKNIFDHLAGSRYYSIIDCASRYWQIPMNPSDKPKTAFATPTRINRLFQFRVCPFGLVNARATFGRAVELILGGLQYSKCLCLLDDVIKIRPH